MRRCKSRILCRNSRISTHAPHAECDLHPAPPQDIHRHFNSRTPRGVRLTLSLGLPSSDTFQLTHPTRSATNHTRFPHSPYDISTHAPHAECDNDVNVFILRRLNISTHAPHAECDGAFRLNPSRIFHHFNSRTPRGVRLKALVNASTEDNISTHAPHAECDTEKTMSRMQI